MLNAEVDIAMPNQRTSSKFLPWIVCFSASLFFFYEFIQMNMFNAISGALMQDFHLTAAQAGRLSATYFYASVIFLFPAGQILDRFSTRKLIIVAMSICIIGTFLFATTHNLQLAGLFRFFTGIGSAFCFLSCVRLASRWFPSHRMALVIGLIVTMAMVGGMVAQTPLTLLTTAVGWRQALMIDAAAGLIFLAWIIFIVKDYPEHFHESHQLEKSQLKGLGYWKSLRMSFLKKNNWFCGIYTCLMNLPIYLLGGIWGILYLQSVHHIEKTSASIITSLLFTGTIIGSPLAGWISDRIRLRKAPMIVGTLLSFIIIFSIMFMSNLNFATLAILFFLLGLVTSTQIISYPTVAESNSKLLTATSVSVVSITTLSGGIIFEPLFGHLMDMHWNGAMANLNPIYAAGDYQFAMWLFPFTFLFSLIVALLIKETHGKKMGGEI
jgi:MFS family permease